jgi:hypothetical protein
MTPRPETADLFGLAVVAMNSWRLPRNYDTRESAG